MNPNWIKGNSGNPGGRPPRPEIQELRNALKEAKEKNNKSFIQHYVEKAYKDNKIAIALANKILPELKEVDLGNNAQEVLRVLFGVDKINEPKSDKVPEDTECNK